MPQYSPCPHLSLRPSYLPLSHILHFLLLLISFALCWQSHMSAPTLIQTLGIDYEALRAQHPTETFVKVFTFNSARKSMSTVIPLEGGGYRLLTKGASEIILDKCTQIMGNEGEVSHLIKDMVVYA